MQKVDNIVANGEIACFEQFLLLPQLFHKLSTAEASKWGKGLKTGLPILIVTGPYKREYNGEQSCEGVLSDPGKQPHGQDKPDSQTRFPRL